MSIRERLALTEHQVLSPYATLSDASKGRLVAEPPCPLRTVFQRDRDRILHSKAFRRLKHKTQVFISPIGDHYRTRLTHSLEVSQVSRTIARALRLNEDLTECIALGHDLGHPPFGHAGETVLNELHPEGFHHQVQSLRIAQALENLNLTQEVLDGMAGGERLSTLEARIVDVADRMAYLHHDAEDAVRAGLMKESDLPADITRVLGETRQARLDTMVGDLIEQSQMTFNQGQPQIIMSNEIYAAMQALRGWMFEHVYLRHDQVVQMSKVRRVLEGLYTYFMENPERIGPNTPHSDTLNQRVLDYVAGMTDRFATDAYKKLLLPQPYQPEHEDDWPL